MIFLLVFLVVFFHFLLFFIMYVLFILLVILELEVHSFLVLAVDHLNSLKSQLQNKYF